MMVQPGEKNSTDQRWLEYTLWDRHQIRMIRRSLKDLHNRGSIDASSGALLVCVPLPSWSCPRVCREVWRHRG